MSKIHDDKSANKPDNSKEDKVRYVKAQKQTRKHSCHWPGCNKQVPPAMWGCLTHWKMIPISLRKRLWDTYEIGQEIDGSSSSDYMKVALEIKEWIRDTYCGGDLHA